MRRKQQPLQIISISVIRRTISESLRRKIIQRAANRCEYCGLAQASQEALFHADHVIPIRSGGPTTFANLALACVSCSLRKGARRTAPDPSTKINAPIYNPRHHPWHQHFRWNGVRMTGLTATGRATVAMLKMNRPLALAIREEEILLGRHPPLKPL